MFDFSAFFGSVKRHPGAAFVVVFLVVVFASTPFLMLWRFAKRAPVIGSALSKVPGAAA